MTEQPQTDPTQLLLQLLDEIKNLKAENEALKKAVTQDIPAAVNKQIEELANGVAEGFKNRDQTIENLRTAPTPTATQPQNSMQQILGQIGGAIEKMVTGGGVVNPEITAPQMELVKTLDKIQLMYAKKFLSDTAKSFGVPEAIEAAHVVVQ